jgi:hypothetical protein
MAVLITLWAVIGISTLLGQAMFRLTPLAWQAWNQSLTLFQRGLFAFTVVFFAYAEGYRGFQKRFSPRVVKRAYYLGQNPSLWRVVFAPFFAMSLFGSTQRQQRVSWSLVVGITCLVILVRQLPQPWRGIVDAGVVVGLGWGLASVYVYLFKWFRESPEPEDLPVQDPPDQQAAG